jgi:hypothetical protein
VDLFSKSFSPLSLPTLLITGLTLEMATTIAITTTPSNPIKIIYDGDEVLLSTDGSVNSSQTGSIAGQLNGSTNGHVNDITKSTKVLNISQESTNTNGTRFTAAPDVNDDPERVKFAYWIPNVSGGLVISKIPQRT